MGGLRVKGAGAHALSRSSALSAASASGRFSASSEAKAGKLEMRHVSRSFDAPGGLVRAVDDVSFVLEPGSSLGVVGESGSGKSTLARMATLFERPDRGSVLLDDADLYGKDAPCRREVYRLVQMVFQNPTDSFNPHRRIGSVLKEAARNFGAARHEADAFVEEAMDVVGLRRECASRFRHQVSGGECQRAAIAKALLAHPAILICDEVTSALDVSVQAQVVEVLRKLRDEKGISLLFITHDLAVMSLLCDHVLVLYCGSCVEMGPADVVLSRPAHPYTQLLLESASLGQSAHAHGCMGNGDIDEGFHEGSCLCGDFRGGDPKISVAGARRARGEHAASVKEGCLFSSRCPYAQRRCFENRPCEANLGEGHFTRCFYPLGGGERL